MNRPTYIHTALTIVVFLTTLFIINAAGQTETSAPPLYQSVKAFELGGGKVDVSNLQIKRDRAMMTFNGSFYLGTPIDGKVTGAVFIGTGNFVAEPPPNDFEKNNLKRLTKADNISTDFKTAVFRFTDDTAALIGSPAAGPATPDAVKMAAEANGRTLRETGANIAARVVLSMLNNETPGFFFGTFEGGKLGRFNVILDHQNRIPTAAFSINGGEKGLVYSYQSAVMSPEVMLAFYSEGDYERGAATYSDVHDLVDIERYEIDADLRSPKSKLALKTKIEMAVLAPQLRAVTFSIGESLGEYESARLKKQMRVKAVRMGAEPVQFVQEDWEGSLTVFLPETVKAGSKLQLEFDLEGDFMREASFVANCFYPISNESWYPRHGYLDRATYDIRFLHGRKLKVATVGSRISEAEAADDKNATLTTYKMTHPVALVTFALGPFERHTETVKFENSEKSIPLEFNSVTGYALPIKESFILAELNNTVRYFNAMFGAYPYDSYSATFHPYGFGQGFPTMLVIPPADRTSKYTFSFISHETAHQWWGNIVAWRSYRDQWLSEGFAEYSGALYTASRDGANSGKQLLDEMRSSLRNPPRTTTGLGSGKLNEIGPIILGHRLNTSKTMGAYQALIYNKGALVLRMLHFLLSDPATGDEKAFFEMMKDFVERHRNKSASTEDFVRVANEHFARSPIGRKYNLKDLNWFFTQWVYNSEIPSYAVEHTISSNPDGSATVKGTVQQTGVPEGFFMPIPVSFHFGGNQYGNGTIHAFGPNSNFEIKLPKKPQKFEVDPNKWLVVDKLSVK